MLRLCLIVAFLFVSIPSLAFGIELDPVEDSPYLLVSVSGNLSWSWDAPEGVHNITVANGESYDFEIFITPPPGTTVLDSAIDWGNADSEGVGTGGTFSQTYSDYGEYTLHLWVFFSDLTLHRKTYIVRDNFAEGTTLPELDVRDMVFDDVSQFMQNVIVQTYEPYR